MPCVQMVDMPVLGSILLWMSLCIGGVEAMLISSREALEILSAVFLTGLTKTRLSKLKAKFSSVFKCVGSQVQ
jgi:hypothetical protein